MNTQGLTAKTFFQKGNTVRYCLDISYIYINIYIYIRANRDVRLPNSTVFQNLFSLLLCR